MHVGIAVKASKLQLLTALGILNDRHFEYLSCAGMKKRRAVESVKNKQCLVTRGKVYVAKNNGAIVYSSFFFSGKFYQALVIRLTIGRIEYVPISDRSCPL